MHSVCVAHVLECVVVVDERYGAVPTEHEQVNATMCICTYICTYVRTYMCTYVCTYVHTAKIISQRLTALWLTFVRHCAVN